MTRKITPPLFLVAWLSFSAAPVQAAAPAAWGPTLFNNKLIHDFGTVARGALAEHRFTIENVYLEDVEIGSVTTTCGCTKLKATKTLLKTYETAEIVAELDTRRFVGFKEATINVSLSFRSADPNRTRVTTDVQLKLRAFIRGDVVFEPGVVQFDSVTPGQTAQKKVSVSYAGRSDWQILEASGTSPHLEVSFKETGRSYDSSLRATVVTYDLVVTLKDTAPAGYFTERILLKSNDQNKQTAQVPLVVQGHVIPSLSVSPTMVMLGVLKPGQTASRNLVVRGEKPFRVLRVSGPDDQFRFTPDSEAKPVQRIGVQFTAGAKPGKVSGKIRVATDLGTVEADVDGQVVPDDSPPAKTGPAANPPKTGSEDADPSRARTSVPDASEPPRNSLRTGGLKEVVPDPGTLPGPK